MRVRAETAVTAWRRTAVDRALLAAGAIVLLASLTIVMQGERDVLWVTARIVPGLVAIGGALLWRTAPTRARVLALVAGFLHSLAMVVVHRAYSVPNPFVGGIFLCVLVALVADRRIAWTTIGASTLVWLWGAWAFVSGQQTLPDDPMPDPSRPGNWLRVVLVFIVLAAAAVEAVSFIVSRLEAALREREELLDALARESERRVQAVREQQALEVRLQQAQKLESLGRLAGGVAHDFNNLLMIIQGNAERLRLMGKNDVGGRRAADNIVTAVDRASTLTRELLAFSRQQNTEARRIDVVSSTQSAFDMLQRLLPASITLHIELADSLPYVWGAPAAIEQILMNLCVNARDAMPEGGQITARTMQVSRPPPDTPGGEERDYILLSVRDTGTGMDDETLQRIFEPFFTTKPPGEGTGLGLSLVHGLAAQCGGFVEVESTPGAGTCFKVYLAVPDQQASGLMRTRPIDSKAHEGNDCVMVVDDDVKVREVLAQALRYSGYEVVEADDGEQALALLRAAPEQFDLVVTDAVMPHMGGHAMYERMLELRSDLPLLVCSGNTDDDFGEGFFRAPLREFLPKPFSPSTFVQKVRALLDEADSARAAAADVAS